MDAAFSRVIDLLRIPTRCYAAVQDKIDEFKRRDPEFSFDSPDELLTALLRAEFQYFGELEHNPLCYPYRRAITWGNRILLGRYAFEDHLPTGWTHDLVSTIIHEGFHLGGYEHQDFDDSDWLTGELRKGGCNSSV